MLKVQVIYIENEAFYTPGELCTRYPFLGRFKKYTHLWGTGYWLWEKMNEYLGEDVLEEKQPITADVFERLIEIGRERGEE